MRNLSFMILSALLFLVAVFLLLVFNEISDCKDTYVVSAMIAAVVSVLPPMFYRSSVPRKIVMVVHIVAVTVASHLLSVVWAEIDYKLCKPKNSTRATTLIYASVVVVGFAMMTVAGHFMKRKPTYNELERVDI